MGRTLLRGLQSQSEGSSMYCSSRNDSGNVVLHDARPAEFNLTKQDHSGRASIGQYLGSTSCRGNKIKNKCTAATAQMLSRNV